MKCIYTDIYPLDLAVKGKHIHLEKGDTVELDVIPNEHKSVLFPHEESVVETTVEPVKVKEKPVKKGRKIRIFK